MLWGSMHFQYLGFTLMFGISMFGWGGMLVRLDRREEYGVALTTVLGLAVVAVIGGLLNMLGVAKGFTLNLLLASGLLLALVTFVVRYRESMRWREFIRENRGWLVAHGLLLFVVTVLLFVTVLIPHAYNYHDDYQKYFVHPVKMIQTGSVFGSPLSSLGKDVLGAQALFQAFFIHNLGLKAANVFDAFFCLLLGAFLLLEEGQKRKVPGFALLAAGMLVTIHPQYVNISSLYSAALLMMAAVFLTPEIPTSLSDSSGRRMVPVIGLAICYSTLVAMKSTYVLFPAVHFSVYVILNLFYGQFRARIAWLAVVLPAMSLFFLLPWASWTLRMLLGYQFNSGDSLLQYVGGVGNGFAKWFSTQKLFYGGTPLIYSALVAVTLLVALSALYLMHKTKGQGKVSLDLQQDAGTCDSLALVAAALTGVVIFLLMMITLQPGIHSFDTALRYTIPFLIALVPPSLMLFWSILHRIQASLIQRGVSVALSLMLVVAFVPETYARARQSIQCGSQLAFSAFACSNTYRKYHELILDGPVSNWVSIWQSKVPSGERLAVWINTAFYLDFNRNEVNEIDISGLDNPWSSVPDSGYLLWDQGGYATRTIKTLKRDAQTSPMYDRQVSIKTLAFIGTLVDMKKRGELEQIYQDQWVSIYKINVPKGS